MNIVMLNYQIRNWKNQKNAAKSKTGTALRISLQMFNGSDLPHELLLKARQ